jgi:hypothetical protein
MKYISKYGGLPMKILIKELYYGRLPAFGEINLRTEEYTNKVKNLLEAEKAILDKFPVKSDSLHSIFTLSASFPLEILL